MAAREITRVRTADLLSKEYAGISIDSVHTIFCCHNFFDIALTKYLFVYSYFLEFLPKLMRL